MVNVARIKKIFDTELKPDKLGENFEEINENAIKLFQKLFVENLNFELVKGQFGEIGEQISTDDWNKIADAKKAFIISEKEEFRIIYVIIKKLTRFRERSAINSLKIEKWAKKGEYICIFYAQKSKIWHMVCPYYTEGITILRRYVLGDGENHRTASENLAKMDALVKEPLFERIQEAFKVQVVTKDFYERYKGIFKEIKDHIIYQGIEVSKAKKFTHLLLNRLMFIYFIQKKSWINNDKNFMFNFLNNYSKKSKNSNNFYDKWLKKLFFEAMSKPISEKSINEFENEINNILNNIPFLNGGLFEEYDVDRLDVKISDDLLFRVIENFLEEYNFTITEESPYDLDIAIDPAMLGKIYESLIAEEERGKSGIFYTPRIEVDLMCRLGIYEFLIQDRTEVLPKSDNIENKITEFIFTPYEGWNPDKSKEFEFLRKTINSIKILDPACGSGAFLVGMMQVLLELYMKLGVIIDFNLKENIIYNALYGVDIKDWAVRMAEFRLWLALIESESKIPDKRPILPNFSFKLQCGDSLNQKINNQDINLKDIRGNTSKNINNKLKELNKLKKEFFEGNKDIVNLIKEKQIEIILLNLQETNDNIKKEVKKKSQRTLDGELSKESMQIVNIFKTQIKENEKIIEQIKNELNYDFFIWDLNFPEIMLLGGFDIVIANPPYIRQEEIINQSLSPEMLEVLSKSQLKKLKDQYKADLIDYALKTYKINIGKTCDLYVFFFLRSIELLNPNGILVYITSNSWLDVKFGKYLKEILLRTTKLEYIIDNRAKRSFEEADINTIITIAKKKASPNYLEGNVNFIAFKKPFEDIINIKTINRVLNLNNTSNQKLLKFNDKTFNSQLFDDVRKLVISETDLWRLGTLNEELKQKNIIGITKKTFIGPKVEYNESKWSIFIKAPDIYFKILADSGEKLIPIKEIAHVQRGYTTGANDFFYLPKPGESNKYFISKFSNENGFLMLFLKDKAYIDSFNEFLSEEYEPIFKIEKEFWMHKIENEKLNLIEIYEYYYIDKQGDIWVPNYVVRTPRELKKLVLIPKELKLICLKIPKNESLLKPGIKKYIAWGILMEYNSRDTCRARNPWYSLGENINQKIICARIINDRFIFVYNMYDVLINNSSYVIDFNNYEAIHCILLNSSLYPLLMELGGRAPYGGGALELSAYEYENLLTFNDDVIKNLNDPEKNFLLSIIQNSPDLKLNSIFSIVKTKNPLDFDIHQMEKKRQIIDNFIFEKILQLKINDQIDLFKSVISLVNTRLKKSKSI